MLFTMFIVKSPIFSMVPWPFDLRESGLMKSFSSKDLELRTCCANHNLNYL